MHPADLLEVPDDFEQLSNDELFKVAYAAGVVFKDGNSRLSLLRSLRRAAM